MNPAWIAVVMTLGILTPQQTSTDRLNPTWLETRKDWTWSDSELHRGRREGFNPMCDPFVRGPGTLNERFINENGWRLSGLSNTRLSGGRDIEVVYGFREFDGMCRPLQYQAFVFVNDSPIGTLSPNLMNSREDASLVKVTLSDAGEIDATFSRYSPSDPLCCASRESVARYSIVLQRNTYILKLVRVETRAVPNQ